MEMEGTEKVPPDRVELSLDGGGVGCDIGQQDLGMTGDYDLDNGEMSSVSEDSQNGFELAMSRRRKRKERASPDEPLSPRRRQVRENVVKVVMKFQRPGLLNPLKVSVAIHKLVGDVLDVKPLRDGSLLIVCRDRDQRMGLIQCKNLLGINVKVLDWVERGKVLSVITGVPTDLSDDDIKKNVKGLRVSQVKRLPVVREGKKIPSLSVLLTLDEPKQPERIMIGYVSYTARPYIPPPTRCYKCQRYGHIASVCKGKIRCAKCGGEHEYGQCGEGTKIKCCNCGGEHSAAYKGCEMHKQAVQVQNVKVKENVTYAEAIKRVNNVNKVRNVNVGVAAAVPGLSTRVPSTQKCCKITDDTLLVDKKNFIAFIAEVVNRAAKIESRTDKIKMIKRAAEKHLEINDLTVLAIHNMLAEPIDSDAVLTPKST